MHNSDMRVRTNLKYPHCSAIYTYELDLSSSKATLSCQNCGKTFTIEVEARVADSSGPTMNVLDRALRQAEDLTPSTKPGSRGMQIALSRLCMGCGSQADTRIRVSRPVLTCALLNTCSTFFCGALILAPSIVGAQTHLIP